MVEEARLEAVASGLAPVTPGWFVVNAADAAWVSTEHTGICIFESDDFVLRGRPDLTEYVKPYAGFTIHVMTPGEPSGGYHAESVQEDFLVVHGECLLIVEGEERHLRTWDYVHCPPGTAHAFVGAGDGPSVIVGSGNRDLDDSTFWREYGESDLAERHRIGPAHRPPTEAWKVQRPQRWDELPWSE